MLKCGYEIWLLFENATPIFTFCGLTSAGEGICTTIGAPAAFCMVISTARGGLFSC
jgi:hypothetical protein